MARNLKLEKRHFEFIATVMKREVSMLPDSNLSESERELVLARFELVARHFASECSRTNPNFQRQRFLEACGFPQE